jgi:hypothetical protein
MVSFILDVKLDKLAVPSMGDLLDLPDAFG